MYAHLYKVSKAQALANQGAKYQLILTDSARPVGGTTRPCQGVREARNIAKQYQATPYNF